MRTIGEIQQALQTAVLSSGCPLSDFSPQSVGYTLFRAIASVLQEVESNLEELDNSSDLISATGQSLDRLTSPFGISRKPASRSTGFALMVARENTTLLSQTVLLEPSSGLQFLAGNAQSLELIAGIETPVPIYSAGIGSNYDLNAGTSLSIPALANVSVEIGYERKFDNTACGNLNGGSLAESDSSLRTRLLSLLRAGGTLSLDSLRAALLEKPNIKDALAITSAPGIVSLIVRAISPTPTLIAEIEEEFRNYLVGTILDIQLAQPLPITIELEVFPTAQTNLDKLKASISETVENFILDSRRLRTFDPAALKRLFAEYDDTIQVESPSKPIVWEISDFIELGELKIAIRI
jgi:Baseplate J-like protein